MFTKMIKTVCLLAIFAAGFSVQATAATTYDDVVVELTDNKAFVFTLSSGMTEDLRSEFMAIDRVIDVRAEGTKVKVYADASVTEADILAVLSTRGFSAITITVIEY